MIVAGLEFTRIDPKALATQDLGCLSARVVELTGLADDDRTGTDQKDGAEVGSPRHRRSRRSKPHQFHELVEEADRVAGAGSGLGVVLDRERRYVDAGHALEGAVVQVLMGGDRFARSLVSTVAGSSPGRARPDRCGLGARSVSDQRSTANPWFWLVMDDLSIAQAPHRMVAAVMTEGQLVGRGPQRQSRAPDDRDRSRKRDLAEKSSQGGDGGRPSGSGSPGPLETKTPSGLEGEDVASARWWPGPPRRRGRGRPAGAMMSFFIPRSIATTDPIRSVVAGNAIGARSGNPGCQLLAFHAGSGRCHLGQFGLVDVASDCDRHGSVVADVSGQSPGVDLGEGDEAVALQQTRQTSLRPASWSGVLDRLRTTIPEAAGSTDWSS